MTNNFQDLLRYIETKTTYKCSRYKEKPLKRRIAVRMRSLHLPDFHQYHDYVKKNPSELKKLLDTLTINLSYFFRNPETFAYVKDSIFPIFRKKRGTLRFWSAGCAHGEEPYSLAIIAAESSLLRRVKIYGTDIDNHTLKEAIQGIYSPVGLQYTPTRIVTHYFRRTEKGYQVKEEIRKRVHFLKLDLFETSPFEPCDLIMCRNVLIYIDRNSQSTILKKLYGQLKSGGFLIIGKVELLIGIPEAKLFEAVSRDEHVYRKIGK